MNKKRIEQLAMDASNAGGSFIAIQQSIRRAIQEDRAYLMGLIAQATDVHDTDRFYGMKKAVRMIKEDTDGKSD